jgi:hypothetical protein
MRFSLKDTPTNERKKVEMRFAHLKINHRFERIRLRGLTGARNEKTLVDQYEEIFSLL